MASAVQQQPPPGTQLPLQQMLPASRPLASDKVEIDDYELPPRRYSHRTKRLTARERELAKKAGGGSFWRMDSTSTSADISNISRDSTQQLQQSAANEEQERGMLREISVEVYSGELVAIVGAVGAGKSSLLTGALLSQMHLVEGSIEIYDTTMALCEQSAFIFNATLRDNILFGSSYDKPR